MGRITSIGANTFPNASRNDIGLLSSKDTLLTRVQLGVHQDSPGPFQFIEKAET